MKSSHYISFRSGSHRVYACDIERRVFVKVGRGGYHKGIRIATVPMNADARADDFPTPSYATKLLNWHQRRAQT